MDVPLDDHTPMAPYGTMYWFRTDALLRMFEWTWRWEDYNAEPHHIDGGLAHRARAVDRLCGAGQGLSDCDGNDSDCRCTKLREIGVQAAAPVCGNADWEYPASGRRSGGDQPGRAGAIVSPVAQSLWTSADLAPCVARHPAAMAYRCGRTFVAAHWRLRQTTQPAHQNQHRNNIYLVGNATRAAGPESLIG